MKPKKYKVVCYAEQGRELAKAEYNSLKQARDAAFALSQTRAAVETVISERTSDGSYEECEMY